MQTNDTLRLALPGHWQARLQVPLIARLPPAEGRKLPNGMVLVTDPDAPDDLYKFVPWPRAQLATNEIDLYARLYADGVDTTHIVRLKAVAGTPDHLVRQMQRAPLGVLDRFLYRHTQGQCCLTGQQIAALLLPIAQALAGLHAAGIVHRDLKAENVLVFAPDGHDNPDPASVHLKLTDFDRAVYLPPGAQLEQSVGSLLHMAPELLAWQPYGHKVDVYAFAMLLTELAHGGSQPHADIGTGMPGSITRAEFSDRVVNDNLRPRWHHPSRTLHALAQDCWQTEPAQRPEFGDVLARLKSLAAGSPLLPPGRRGEHVLLPPSLVGEAAPQRWKRVGLACHLGKVRHRMEDAAAVLHCGDSTIAAVFDGLRDARASAFAAHQLPLLLADILARTRTDASPEPVNEATAKPTLTHLHTTLAQVEHTLRNLQPAVRSGSTATVAVWRGGALWLAWLGDSPAWLLRQRDSHALEVVALTQPHHPSRSDEAARITAAGGRVGRAHIWMDDGSQMPSGPVRVYADPEHPETGVALSRALGLFACKPALSAEPDTLHLCAADLTRARFLLLGSDGVFDALDQATVADTVTTATTAQHAANALIAAVLQRGGADNASVVVLDLQQPV